MFTIVALIAAALAAVAIAVWPASEADMAREDGELHVAVDDLSSQAGDFRAQGPEVQQAFWEGYEEGLSG